ncbi:MAG: hypothetical protein JO025_21335 [Verrucomicrobia bacterium]|nr:hypothetical protein [Verrucomicrobiota bacterium]
MTFKQRLLAREALIGTWIKSPSRTVAEVLSKTGIDLLCLDAEHAPFDREAIDAAILPCRASGKPVLVRTRSSAAVEILNALDCGATGVLLPHVRNREEATRAATAAHFGPNGRGYAGSTRAADFATKKMAEHLRDSTATTTVIAQIEDEEGVNDAEEIASVQGIDALFIGWNDLMVVHESTDSSDERVVQAAARVAFAAIKANKAVGMFVPNVAMVPEWIKTGVTFFLLESDQVFLLKGAESLISAFRSKTASS